MKGISVRLSRRYLAVGMAFTVGTVAAVGVPSASAVAVPAGPSSPNTAWASAAQKVAELVAGRPAFLQSSVGESFVAGKPVTVGASQYVPYERTYAGLPEVGGDFVLATDASGQLLYDSVALKRPVGALAITPTLRQADAEAVAAKQLRSVSQVEGSRLVVDALGATARLAWESTVDGVGADGVSRLTVYVDAGTGGVLDTREHVAHGSGTAAWNGPNPVPLNTTHSGATFSMTDPTIANLSCQDLSGNTVFTGPDDAWGNGDATNRETGCVDALFGVQTETRMLTQWLGRNGFDGNGGGWPIRVGLQQQNAFYDGTQVQIGHNTAGQWVGSIDVVAHEFGHGIDDHTPGGISRAGTQEFVADTFGASTEWFANEPAPFDTPDFTVGEKINLVGSGPIRNMANPSAVDNDPNCYSSSIPNTEVHAAAGPGNHWFYLLAEGTNPTNGQPTSPTCNNSTVAGIGVQNAMRIMYGAMQLKTTASSYPMYRSWTLQAALSLFPGSCIQYNTVKAAWDAVSVPAQPTDPTCTPHLAYVKTRNTGAGLVEVHQLPAPYQSFDMHALTGFSATEDGNGTFEMQGGNLVYFKTSNTASGRVELHIRTAASGFQSGADVATTFVVGDGGNGVFELVNGDIVFIKTRNTGSGKIEVHRVSAANLSGPPVQDAATALSGAEAGNGTFQMSGNDLVYIKTRNTGGTRVELHVVDGGTNYTTFKVHTPTVFATSDADNGVWSVRNLFSAGIGDLVFIKTRNTASGTVELFAAGAAGNYQQPNLQTSTGIGVSDGANGFFNLNLG